MKLTKGAVVIETPLTYIKSTGGTHVFGNEDTIRSVYIPKIIFNGTPVEGMTLTLTVTVEKV